MITEEELLVIKEKLYDNEKYPYINGRLIAKKLFEELALMRANSVSSREEKLHAELAKIKENEVSSRNEFRYDIQEWKTGVLGKEGEAGKSPKEYIEELEKTMFHNNECNLEIQKSQREYIEELKRLIDTTNTYNIELQSYHGLLELRIEQLEKENADLKMSCKCLKNK